MARKTNDQTTDSKCQPIHIHIVSEFSERHLVCKFEISGIWNLVIDTVFEISNKIYIQPVGGKYLYVIRI